MTLTFQKEVAERITAPPNHPQRSRLSIMAQHLCDIKWAFDLPSSVFVPQPKVDAAVLHMVPLVNPVLDVPFDTVEVVVKSLFNFRRKIISNGARLLFPERSSFINEFFALSGVNPRLRAQQLTLQQWGQLCSAYIQLAGNLEM
jgi:dimethyladenosine transferase 1